MKFALGQFAATDDIVENLTAIEAFMVQAARGDADYVVFPEAAMFVSAQLPRLKGIAQSLDGDYVGTIRGFARDYHVGVVAPMWERDGDAVYNTLVVIDASGEIVTSYRKVHLYDAFGFKESDVITPSNRTDAVTFDVGDLRPGLSTCYDLRFPESARALIDAGADIIILPAAWLPGPLKEDHWVTLARARAIENTAYVVAVNQAAPVSTGGSLVIGPDGVITAALGPDPQLRIVELDSAQIESARSTNPSLSNRRFTVALTPGADA